MHSGVDAHAGNTGVHKDFRVGVGTEFLNDRIIQLVSAFNIHGGNDGQGTALACTARSAEQFFGPEKCGGIDHAG